jgi:signal peptidase
MTAVLSNARLALTWFALGIALALTLALAAPLLFGARPLTVLSGSMEPALMTGDVVVVKSIDPIAARPGDVVTFRSPSGRALITHRVQRMRARGQAVQFVTKGDANVPVERWQVDRGEQIRRVVLRVPLIGYGLNLFRTRLGLIALVLVPLVLLGFVELWSIWRPEPEGDHEPAT